VHVQVEGHELTQTFMNEKLARSLAQHGHMHGQTDYRSGHSLFYGETDKNLAPRGGRG